jgi:hypothetical protein
MIIRIIILLIIVFQFCLICYLLSQIENNEKENQKYFDKLRREYDTKLESYREDIEIRDEIIEGLKRRSA